MKAEFGSLKNKDYDRYINQYKDKPVSVPYKQSDDYMKRIYIFMNDMYHDETVIPTVIKKFGKGMVYGLSFFGIMRAFYYTKNDFLIAKLISGLAFKEKRTFLAYKYYKNFAGPYIFYFGLINVGYHYYHHLITETLNFNKYWYLFYGPGLYFGAAASILLSPNIFVGTYLLSTYLSYNFYLYKGKLPEEKVIGKYINYENKFDEDKLKYLESREKIHYLSWKYYSKQNQDKTQYIKEF